MNEEEFTEDAEAVGTPVSEELVYRTDAADACSRLDVFLTERMNGQTRSYIRKLIEEGHVRTSGTDSVPSLPEKPG